MKTLQWCWIAGLLALGLTGCKSYGPAFDPYSTQNVQGSGGTPEGQARRLFWTNSTPFTAVSLTNEAHPEWLRPNTNLVRLGPGDTIEIETVGEEGAKFQATLGPDGKIYYGLLPGVSVWGLTLAETRALLEQQLAKYVRVKPELLVTLRRATSLKVWVLGNVGAPGLYPLDTPRTLLEVLSMAGGPVTQPGSSVEVTDLRRSFLMRRGEMLKVDFHRLMRGGDMTQNVYLESDDFLYVRPATSKSVFVLGSVAHPAAIPYGEQLFLSTVLANAGGPTEYAYLSHVAIIRGSLSEPEAAIVDLKKIIRGGMNDVKLEPGDIVFVPESPYKDLRIFVTGIVSQFVRTIAVNAGYKIVYPNVTTPVGVSVPVGGDYLPVGR